MGSMVFVPVFDGNNYEIWSLQMKALFKRFDLWDVVEKGTQPESLQVTSSTSHEFEGVSYDALSSAVDAEKYLIWWKQSMEWKDANALSLIQSGLSTEVFPWIAYATSSKEVWELLMVRSVGGPIFQARKLSDLKKEYNDITMSDAETIHEFIRKLMDLVFRMKSCGWEVEDNVVVKKILSSLPPRFDRVLVEVAATLSISVLIDCLLVHEYNIRPDHEFLEESVVQKVYAEESFQTEILYSLDDITQCQVAMMDKQREVHSLVQQNQKMLMQMQKQMMMLTQQQEQLLLRSKSYDNQEEMTRVIESMKKHNLKKK